MASRSASKRPIKDTEKKTLMKKQEDMRKAGKGDRKSNDIKYCRVQLYSIIIMHREARRGRRRR